MPFAEARAVVSHEEGMAEARDMGLAGEKGLRGSRGLKGSRGEVFSKGGEGRGGILLAGLRADGRAEHIVEEVRALRRGDRVTSSDVWLVEKMLVTTLDERKSVPGERVRVSVLVVCDCHGRNSFRAVLADNGSDESCVIKGIFGHDAVRVDCLDGNVEGIIAHFR